MTTELTERPRRTPAGDEIPALLEALAASRGNTAVFAQEHGLTRWKLHEAQRVAAGAGQLRRRRRNAELDFVWVQVVEERSALSALLQLVRGSTRARFEPLAGLVHPQTGCSRAILRSRIAR